MLFIHLFLRSKGRRLEAKHKSRAVAAPELPVTAASSPENPDTDETEGAVSEETREAVQEDEEPAATEKSTSEELSEATGLTCLTCLTVQPSRVLCGVGRELITYT